jgi:hypothetical protein
MHFSFIITGRRSLQFAQRCINSIVCQQGSFSYDWLYIDDASGYNEAKKNQLLEFMNHRVLFLEKRHFQLGAIAKGISQLKDQNAIVCLVDGDDYLLGDALSYVTKAYENPDIAMTYGNVLLDFRPYQDLQSPYFLDKQTVNTEYSDEVWRHLTFRQDGFRCFHLRTFRRWIWDFIDPMGFYRPNGDPIRASGDSAFIFPMLELLGEKKHVAFIETPIYVYRLHTGNVHCHDKKSQYDDLEYIRFSLKPSHPLNRSLLKSCLKGVCEKCVE